MPPDSVEVIAVVLGVALVMLFAMAISPRCRQAQRTVQREGSLSEFELKCLFNRAARPKERDDVGK